MGSGKHDDLKRGVGSSQAVQSVRPYVDSSVDYVFITVLALEVKCKNDVARLLFHIVNAVNERLVHVEQQ